MNDLGFIHRYVPEQPGGSGRTLLLLHGTGGNEDDLLGLGRNLLPNAALLSPRGKVLENGMPRFFRRLAEGVFDEADLIARTHELAEFVSRAAAHYGLDAGKITALGYSNGANIAASTMLLRPGVLSSAALLRPMVPLIPEHRPDLAGARILISSGRMDPICPPDQTDRLAELLRSSGASVTVAWQQAGHNLTQEDLTAARSWLVAL